MICCYFNFRKIILCKNCPFEESSFRRIVGSQTYPFEELSFRGIGLLKNCPYTPPNTVWFGDYLLERLTAENLDVTTTAYVVKHYEHEHGRQYLLCCDAKTAFDCDVRFKGLQENMLKYIHIDVIHGILK